MKKTIYIHIGMPLAGSTSIQNFLRLNQKKMENLGYHPHAAFIAIDIKSLNNKLKNKKALVFTSELYLLNIPVLFKVYQFCKKNGLSIKIICYLRKPIEFYYSAYNLHNSEQKVKNIYNANFGNTNTFLFHPYSDENSDYFKFYNNEDWLINYEKSMFDSLTDTKFNIPKEFIQSFQMQILDKTLLYKNDLLYDFLHKLNINDVSDFIFPNTQHISKSRGYMECLELLKSSDYSFSFDTISTYLNYNCANFGDQRKYIETVSDEEIKRITELLLPTYNKVAKIFLNRDELFENPYPDIYGKPRAPYKPLSPDEIAKIQEFIEGQRSYQHHIERTQIQENINRVEQTLNAKIDVKFDQLQQTLLTSKSAKTIKYYKQRLKNMVKKVLR